MITCSEGLGVTDGRALSTFLEDFFNGHLFVKFLYPNLGSN